MDSPHSVYLDYAATTPLDRAALEAMMPFLTEEFGNPASQHPIGRRASDAVEEARSEIAALVGADLQEIVFTSGATESINLALKGVMTSAPPERRHFVTAATEHKAILDTAHALESDGARVTILPVDRYGRILMPDLEAAISNDTWLVSLMGVKMGLLRWSRSSASPSSRVCRVLLIRLPQQDTTCSVRSWSLVATRGTSASSSVSFPMMRLA